MTRRLIFRMANLRKVCYSIAGQAFLLMFHLMQSNHPAQIGPGIALSGSLIWSGTGWLVFSWPFSVLTLTKIY